MSHAHTHTQTQFFGSGQFGDVKKAKWNGKVVAVKCFSTADRKGGFQEEVSSLLYHWGVYQCTVFIHMHPRMAESVCV